MDDGQDRLIGFVGLGAMGGGIVARLLGAGHSIIGHNRTQSKAQHLIELGMLWGETPRSVSESADVIFSSIADTAALRAIAGGPNGVLDGLSPGKIWLEMSTVSPAYSRDLATQVAEKGSRLLDAPVSGSVITLEAGELAIMVGGDYEAFERVKPILQDIGPTINHMGPNGSAATMKLALNLALPVQILAFSEGVIMAEKAGVPREKAVDVYLNTVVASPALHYRAPLALDPTREALFNVDMMQKDLRLALEAGRETAVPLPATAITNEMLTAARGMGWAEKDFAILFDVIATMAGVET